MKTYREGGPEALRSKLRGRQKGASPPHRESIREEELVCQVQKLKAEVAYLKIDCPADGAALSNREKAAALSRSLRQQVTCS